MEKTVFDINADQAVRVVIYAIQSNSLILDFKFYDSNGVAYNVASIQFTFTITDSSLSKEKYKVTNSQWTRPFANEIKKTIPALALAPDTYKVDLTATYSDGTVQTFMDGDLVLRERYIHI